MFLLQHGTNTFHLHANNHFFSYCKMAVTVATGLLTAHSDSDDAEIQGVCLLRGLTVGTHRARCHALRYLLE